MKIAERVMRSEYMHWAKTQVHTKYNLGISGISNYPLSELPVSINDLEITGNSYYGYAPLIEAIAIRYGVPTEKVFGTIGTSMANHLVMAATLDIGDEVLIECPTYELLLSTAGYFRATIQRFPRRSENGFQIDPDDIRRSISSRTKLIIITNLHNPTSILLPDMVLREIGRIAQTVGAYVLVDEVYLDAAYELSPRSSIHLGNEFIVTNSLTKVYGLSGLRCGWVLAHPDIITKLWRLNDLFNVIPSHPSELLSVIAFKHLDRILERTKSIIEPNRKILKQFLDDCNNLESVQPSHGNVMFPLLKNGNVDHLCSLLMEKYETLVVPGKFFEMAQHFRIGLGIDRAQFQEGIYRLGKALDEIR